MIIALFSTGCDGGSTLTADRCGDIKPAVAPIRNGVELPEAVSLTEGQMKSIGALNIDMSGSCTATLVGPSVVITAAHCVENASSQVLFIVGESYRSPERTFRASSWHLHPQFAGTSGGFGRPEYDIAVVLLEEDATAAGLEPVPVNLNTFSLVGKTIQAVGYGMTRPGDYANSQRWWTTMPVSQESPLTYTADGAGVTGICQGDSGGPMLYDVPGQGVSVMGVVSGGDSYDCLGHTYYPRTDAYVDFLDDFISVGPCGWETWTGRCEDDTAVWCENDEVLYHDCTEFGWVCGLNDENLNRCIEPPPPCLDETLAGRCEGETAVWCEDDEILYHDCASFGWYCGLDDQGFYRCVDDPCRGEDVTGRCIGQIAAWCEDGLVLYHNCGEFGWECGPNAEGRFRCIEPGTGDECSRLGHQGECIDRDGHVIAMWCSDGVIHERDCTVCEQECGWTGLAQGYYCY
jgi:V8-like Glu-specific endopeptidase